MGTFPLRSDLTDSSIFVRCTQIFIACPRGLHVGLKLNLHLISVEIFISHCSVKVTGVCSLQSAVSTCNISFLTCSISSCLVLILSGHFKQVVIDTFHIRRHSVNDYSIGVLKFLRIKIFDKMQ